MVDIILDNTRSAYDVVEDFVKRYWEHNGYDDVVILLGLSEDGYDYELIWEVARPDKRLLRKNNEWVIEKTIVRFISDVQWWEGERYLKMIGIKSLDKLIWNSFDKFNIDSGLYAE